MAARPDASGHLVRVTTDDRQHRLWAVACPAGRLPTELALIFTFGVERRLLRDYFGQPSL
jgi:hypothetical protein